MDVGEGEYVYVWDQGRTHIAAIWPGDWDLVSPIDAPAECGRKPKHAAWPMAWLAEGDLDLCDRCARLAEGRGAFQRSGLGA